MQKEKLYNLSLLAIVLFLMLIFSELVFRMKFSGTAYVPSKEIQKIQSLLKLHPSIGYLWKENITLDSNIILKYKDQVALPLTTDSIGFFNHPEAIQERKKGKQIDIIGLGDSFINNAATVFFLRFRTNNIFYYNMAMDRHCPPQYNLILDAYAKIEKPSFVIYGLYENDFYETEDFESWKKSGMDWFTYHSGIWFGRPLNNNRIKIFFIKNLKGSYAFYRLLVAKLNEKSTYRVKPLNDYSREKEGSDKIFYYISEAYEMAKKNNIKFILLIIPAKEATPADLSHYPDPYNGTISLLKKTDIPILDLRKIFSQAENPRALFYVEDNHWNEQGMSLAADAIIDYIMEMNSGGVNPKDNSP